MSHIPAERCLHIVELLAEGAQSIPLGEIATRLGLPKSGTHRLLTTLVELGWAAQDAGTGFYRLTMRLAVVGQKFYVASGLPDICQPLLDRLALECREFARLAVVDGHSLDWIAYAQGVTGGLGLVYQPAETTGSVPLYATASGKAWLSTLDAAQATRLVKSRGGFTEADRYGPNVLRSIGPLLADLEATRARGYGLAVNEAEPGVTAVAVAIRSAGDGAAVGTVSIAGPTARVDANRVRELAPRVMQCASELSALWPLRAAVPVPVPGNDRPPARRSVDPAGDAGASARSARRSREPG
jgi:DNA-binding IclR family transcriptional regulator